jgi:IclR family mhp operon transcriptional activator
LTYNTQTIRALDRGLIIIEHLSKTGRTSLARLRAQTGLSNATLLRILATLQERNWVRKSVVDAKYELSHTIGIFLRTGKYSHPVAEAAAPVMRRLRDAENNYPSDLAVPVAAGVIEIIETTRRKGPHSPIRPPYGIRPSIVFSGHGRTTLAFCTPSQKMQHIDAIKALGTREEKRWAEDGRLDAAIKETQHQGFGIPASDYWIGEFDDGPEFGAIAYPVFAKGIFCATLNMLWLDKDISLHEMLTHSSSGLVRKSVEEIGIALGEMNYVPELKI